LLQEVSSGPAPVLPQTELADFMRHFAESNARVAAEYFGRLLPDEDPLFGPLQAKGSRAQIQPLPAETAVHIAARLWEEKQQQLAKLNERIANLEARLAAKRGAPELT
jgi:hypothetical protein